MALTKYTPSNNAQGQLLAGISAGALTLILQSGQGGRFPSVYPYLLEVKQNDTVAPYAVLKREIVKVTNRVGDTFTIVRSSGTCLPDDSSNTQGTTAFSFSTGDTVTLTVTAETIKDIQDELATKLSSVAWLRTGFGTNKHVRVNLASGVEEIKSVSAVSSIASIDKIRVEDGSTGDYKDAPYSVIESAILWGQAQDSIAWEALTANDAVLYEYIYNSLWAATSGIWKALTQKMWDVSWNTRVSMMLVWNGISASSLVLWLWKTWAPTDNLVVRIETDNAGVPSGTLAHANATANIAWTWLTTSPVNTTINFWWAFTLTSNTLYHLVVQRQNAVDWSNNYNIAAVTRNVRFFKRNLYNGSTWWSASSTVSLHLWSYAGANSRVVVKTVANVTEQASFDGIATSTVSIGATVKINREGLMAWFSGLTNGAAYFLSNTAGAISTTPGTTIREVWYAVGTDKLYIKNSLYNPSNYEFVVENPVSVINEASSVNWAHTSYSCRAIAKWKIGFWINSANSNTLNVFINNTLARTVSGTSISVVFHDIYPGDIITANFAYWGSWFYGRVVQFQQLLAPITRSE